MKKRTKLLRAIGSVGGEIIERGDDEFACTIDHGVVVYVGTDEKGFQREVRHNGKVLHIIVSWGGGWDHVSVHCRYNDMVMTPGWEDMCFVKDFFFKPSETVVQFHPSKDVYVNEHEHVLHLWRPQSMTVKLPPIWMV